MACARVRIVAMATVLLLLDGASSFAADCNANGLEDAADIEGGISEDCNGNQLPDECEIRLPQLVPAEQIYPVSRTPTVIVTVDLNGDEDVDLVALGRRLIRSEISILINVGDGFQAVGESLVIDSRVFSLACDDLNGDGALDLLAAAGSEVVVFPGTGDGTFGARAVYPNDFDARYLATGDVDGDARADVIVANRTTTSFSLLKNTGDGALDAPQVVETLEIPERIATADFDGDGHVDVVVLHRSVAGLSVYRGGGDGSFGPGVSYALDGRRTGALFSADFDGDGDADVLATTDLSVALLRNQGDGTFADAELFAGGGSEETLVDFDGDGDLDLLAKDVRASLRVRFNDGAGRFGVSVELRVDNHLPSALAAADIDGDGDVDVVIDAADGVQLLVAQAGESFLIETETLRVPDDCDSRIGCRPHSGAVVDLNGDGALDLLGCLTHFGHLSIALGDSTGNFTFLPTYKFISCHPISTAAGDMDGDGDADIVTVDDVDDDVFVHLNSGDATFTSSSYPTPRRAGNVRLADLDGDGDLDTITANQNDASVSVLRGLGDGTLDESRADYRVGSSPRAVAVADLDGDGDIDLAAANTGSSNVSILENKGDGTFESRRNFPVLGGPTFIEVADVDRDGDPDLVLPAGSRIVALLNSGADFSEARVSPAGQKSFSISVVDLDGDELPDVVSAGATSELVALLRARGDGTFEAPFNVGVQGEPRYALPGDLDADGDFDLVTVNRDGRSMTLISNRASGRTADFLEGLCRVQDFDGLAAVARGRPGVRYLLAAEGDLRLPPVLFENTKRFGSQLEFLTSVFSESFASLDETAYNELVQRRQTRQFFSGSIVRLDAEAGVLYGFDLLTAPDESELLSAGETLEVFQRLRAAFLLESLVYLPSSPAARQRAQTWVDAGFEIIIEKDDEPLPDVNPVFTLEISANATACGVFQQDREPELEYVWKSEIGFREGTYSLPTDAAAFDIDLVTQCVLGPEQLELEPSGGGRFDVSRFSIGGGETVYRFQYAQEFMLPDGSPLEIALASPLQFRARGEELIDRIVVFDEEFFTTLVGREAWVVNENGEPRVNYGSCVYDSLPLFEVRATLNDGVRLLLRERLRLVPEDTGPAALVRATVGFGDAALPAGTSRNVTDYWQLVYTARRHNEGTRYWVELDPPVMLRGAPAPARVVELTAPRPLQELGPVARYLGDDLETLFEVGVMSFEKAEVGDTAVLFRRGDVQGDGSLNIEDVLRLLDFLFRRAATLTCGSAADANDDGQLNILDPIRVVRQLFGGREPLPAPAADCGFDATADGLTCESFDACAGDPAEPEKR